MLGLPQSTEFNKRLAKQVFYENLDVPANVKRYIVDQIKTIYWKHKIAVSTTNLAAGEAVIELQIFEIHLNGKELNESVLKLIDKQIPYHILFLLENDERYQAWIGYKEASNSSNAAFKVNKYYHTEWMQESELPLKLEGLSVDAVYESFVRQIAGDALAQNEAGESLKESVNRDEEIQALKKQIEKIQAKIRKEKQLNVQVKLNTELKALTKNLRELKGNRN